MIWGNEDRDPLEYDEIRAELNNINLDEVEQPNNYLLDEVLDFYDCADLLPLAQRVIWLSAVKEACGIIPQCIDVDCEELRLLVVLQEEQSKKVMYDTYRMKQESKRNAASIEQMRD